MEHSRPHQELMQLTLNKSTKKLINAIQTNEIARIGETLALYRERGVVNPLSVIKAVPLTDRLPELAKKGGRYHVAMLLNVALVAAFEKMNLRYPMKPAQVVELAEQIIDSSEEDQLALEDVMLFLQQLVRGQAGKIYDRMDIPTFFELFENYRENRHRAYMAAKEEFDVQARALPVNDRLSDMFKPFEQEQYKQAINSYLRVPKEETE